MTFLENNRLAVVEAAAAAAQTELVSDTVEMKHNEGVVFLAILGDVTATSVLTLTLQTGDASDGSDAEDTGIIATFTAGASDADSKILAVEGSGPTKKYCRAKLTRTTADAVVGGIVAIQTNPRGHVPITQHATVIDHAIGAPIEAA